MARQVIGDAQPKMDGGLNEVSDDPALLPNQLRRATNARLTDFGAITKRGGTRRTANAISSLPILNGYTWNKDSGSDEIMIVTNGLLYTSLFSAFPWTYTAQVGALATNVVPSFAQFRDGANDVVYIGDGGPLNRWNGTTLTTDIAGTINAKYITVHNERLWSCGCGSAPDSIFYSSLNNGDTLGNGSAGGGQIIVRTFGDEPVVGLASINASLLIFHNRGISRLTGFGQDDISVTPQGVTADVGTIAPLSIAVSNNIGYFISERGLYACNEADVAPVGTVDVPDPLLPLIRTLSAADFQNIRAVINRGTRELWITIPNYGCYVYHTLLQAWAGPWDGAWISPQTTALFETINSEGLPVVLKGDESGFISLCDAPGVTTDNAEPDSTGGERYTMAVQFHRLYCGDEALAKAWRWGYLTVALKGSDESRVDWISDENSGSYALPPSTALAWGSGTWGTGTWGGQGSVSYRIPMGGTGYYLDVTFVDSGRSLPVVSRFQLEAFALGRR
jgi:hypothetical protein